MGAYLKEAGDQSISKELVACDNMSGTETPLHGHLQRFVGYTLERTSPAGRR